MSFSLFNISLKMIYLLIKEYFSLYLFIYLRKAITKEYVL